MDPGPLSPPTRGQRPRPPGAFRTLSAVVQGYGGLSLDDPSFRNAIEVAILDRVTGGIAWRTMVGDTSDMERMVTALRQALAGIGIGDDQSRLSQDGGAWREAPAGASPQRRLTSA